MNDGNVKPVRNGTREEIAQSLDALNANASKSSSKRKVQLKNALDGLKIVDAQGGLLGQTIVTPSFES